MMQANQLVQQPKGDKNDTGAVGKGKTVADTLEAVGFGNKCFS